MPRTNGTTGTMTEAEIAVWLAEQGLTGTGPQVLFAEYCERLVALGLPVERANLSLETLHPQIAGYGYVWRRDGGVSERSDFLREQPENPAWTVSPFRHMLERRMFNMRVRLEARDEGPNFPIFDEFRAEGMTDWYAEAVSFGWLSEISSTGELGLLTSWTTRQPGGFTDADLARLRRLLLIFALALKSTTLRDMAQSIAETYLGRDAGRRVIGGAIARGSTQTIRAALFYADLRGFTRLADRLPRDEVIPLLDNYFEVIVPAVEERGGQVLKFLGDGLLATFGFESAAEEAATCRRALDAAEAVLSNVARFNRDRRARGADILPLDIALHVGDISYGNVGAADRLDFTVVGAAVNEASRIEALCSDLEVSLLASAAFAEGLGRLDGRLVSRGRHTLRGVSAEQELFSVADDMGSS